MTKKQIGSMKASSAASRTIARHYGKRSITVAECDAEIANLQRKANAGTLDDNQERLAAALGIVKGPQGNDRYIIARFSKGSEFKSVYMLHPGDVFAGFGGSSLGLLVRKTASLIVRESGPTGTYDTEYDIDNRAVWQRIFAMAKDWERCALVEV